VTSRRIDYYDDPEAPRANSLVPSVNVAVSNEACDLLLIRRTDNGNWALPGGAIDLGESVAQAAVRETREETGIECEVTGIVGIYSDPRHVILYTSDCEVRQEFSIVLTARALSGQPTPSSESSEVRWVPRPELSQYVMDRSMHIRISDFLESGKSPVVTRDGYQADRSLNTRMPSHVSEEDARGFALALGKLVPGGGVGEILNIARLNVRNVPV
jgi:8-oxo-dGTP pyrophosphatase MutT (NUDIX family)